MADAGAGESLDATRLRRCFELASDPTISTDLRSTCRAVIEGHELRADNGDPSSIGFAAALLWASLFFAVAWGFRGAMGR